MGEAKNTPGPWEYVPSTEHHGPYVTSEFGSTVCDCYVMSRPGEWSVANGGQSKPIHHLHEMADPNARLIAAAPELLSALESASGYLLNAKIDLETGAPKRTAICTIEGGLKVVRAAIAKATGGA